jgi:hypothetical protein
VTQATLFICEVMKLAKEFKFFAFLLESYAAHKGTTPDKILKILDEKNLTQFVYDMYFLYHIEAIENAFTDLDSLIQTGKPAY